MWKPYVLRRNDGMLHIYSLHSQPYGVMTLVAREELMIHTANQSQHRRANGTFSNVSSSDANDRFIKAMDELQHFVSKTHKKRSETEVN